MFPPHFPSVTTDQLNGLDKTTDPKQPLHHQQQTKNLTESCELDTKVHNLDSGSRSVYSLGNKKKLETRNSPVHYQKMGRPQINVQNDSLQQSPHHHLHPPKHLLSLSPVQCALLWYLYLLPNINRIHLSQLLHPIANSHHQVHDVFSACQENEEKCSNSNCLCTYSDSILLHIHTFFLNMVLFWIGILPFFFLPLSLCRVPPQITHKHPILCVEALHSPTNYYSYHMILLTATGKSK